MRCSLDNRHGLRGCKSYWKQLKMEQASNFNNNNNRKRLFIHDLNFINNYCTIYLTRVMSVNNLYKIEIKKTALQLCHCGHLFIHFFVLN